MTEVSDILRDRMQGPDGLQRMAVVSALAHAALFAILVLAPTGWLGRIEQSERVVMTISLGAGGEGAATPGMTAIGARPVQAPAPVVPQSRPEPVRIPAARTPEMTVPTPDARRAPRSAPVKQAPPDARGRTPTRGAEPAAGTALAETGARGQGFGLTAGGGPGSGSQFGADFCCNEYVALMIERIRSNWNQRSESAGVTTMKFTIHRDGRITYVEVDKPSLVAHNLEAQRAVLTTRQLPPLPAAYTNPTLVIYLHFQYSR